MSSLRAFLTEFIEKYKSHPCLWNQKHPNYHHKTIRAEAYEDLLKYYKQVEPIATADIVRTKINNLRTNFRREESKVEKSKKMGEHPPYMPKLWYYDLFLFINDGMKVKPVEKNKHHEADNDDNYDSSNVLNDCEWENAEDEEESKTFHIADTIVTRNPPSVVKKRKIETEIDDECEAIARNVACKLKRMNSRQRNFAEILINQAVVYGVSDRLTEDSTITPIESLVKISNDETNS